jgi:hypothetical protein
LHKKPQVKTFMYYFYLLATRITVGRIAIGLDVAMCRTLAIDERAKRGFVSDGLAQPTACQRGHVLVGGGYDRRRVARGGG